MKKCIFVPKDNSIVKTRAYELELGQAGPGGYDSGAHSPQTEARYSLLTTLISFTDQGGCMPHPTQSLHLSFSPCCLHHILQRFLHFYDFSTIVRL